MPKTEQHVISVGLSKRLGDLLVDAGTITEPQLQEALNVQHKEGGKLGSILIRLGHIEEEELLHFLSKQCGLSYVKLAGKDSIPKEALSAVPEGLARQHILFPVDKKEGKLVIALSDPLNVLVLDDLKMMTGCEVTPVLASESEILAAIDKYYGAASAKGALEEILRSSGMTEDQAQLDVVEETGAEAGESIETLKVKGQAGPVIQMVNLILAGAIRSKASDIHFEPYPKQLRVRYRLDGVLHEQPAPPKKFQNAIVSRLKIMANLDIAERRRPQDGRIKVKIEGKEIDMRASFLPCAPGEKVVLRILDSSGLRVQMTQLGFEVEQLAVFQRAMKAPYGINLVTGPTGSGKSTTLYSALSILNQADVNILTVEDPVEYQLLGINQVQVNPEIGLTFAEGLRSFLRQDPDIIMVGEIRDLETVQIAINAALTGHLVFSTLHTNDAPSSITRLAMMGVEPFLITASLLTICAQRLMRVICVQCKEKYEVEAEWLRKLGVPDRDIKAMGGKVPLWRGRGCDHCSKTGYRGRMGIYEVLDVTDGIRELILGRAPVASIRELARKQGMSTLRESAIRKLLAGTTTVEEMIRLTAQEG